MPEIIRTVNLDANETAFFARELEVIKARTYDIKFPELKATRLIPVSLEAGSGAETITYQQFTEVGIMKVIANYADDLPRSDIKGAEFTSKVRSLGGSYGYNVQEIRAAQMAGRSLTTRKAAAVRRANDQSINRITWLARVNDGVNGGLQGMFYNPNITAATVQAGATTSNLTWATKNPDEIVKDLMDLIDDVKILTKGVEVPDTILLPIAQHAIASSTRMAAGTDTTILEFFLKNRPGVSVEWLNECAAVNPIPSTLVATPTDIAVAYKKDPMNLTLEIPQPFEQFPVQERNLEFVVPAHSRIGGVIIYYPLSVNIIEGI